MTGKWERVIRQEVGLGVFFLGGVGLFSWHISSAFVVLFRASFLIVRICGSWAWHGHNSGYPAESGWRGDVVAHGLLPSSHRQLKRKQLCSGFPERRFPSGLQVRCGSSTVGWWDVCWAFLFSYRLLHSEMDGVLMHFLAVDLQEYKDSIDWHRQDGGAGRWWSQRLTNRNPSKCGWKRLKVRGRECAEKENSWTSGVGMANMSWILSFPLYGFHYPF